MIEGKGSEGPGGVHAEGLMVYLSLSEPSTDKPDKYLASYWSSLFQDLSLAFRLTR